MNEEWKSIENSNGDYMISNFGRVKSFKYGHERILKTRFTKDGYIWYSLCFNGKQKGFRAHRLVAIHFLENPKSKETVNHIDGNKTNNLVSNLEWSTREEQMQHAYKMGLKKPVQGYLQGKSLLTEQDVKEIRKTYKGHSKEFGMTALSKKYNVSISTINKCVGGRSYKNVD